MKIIFMILVASLLFVGVTSAQECGPSCPVCSGAGTNNGALLSQKSVMVSGLYIPSADEEKAVINSRFGLLNWLDAGIGYAIETEKVLWNVRAQLLVENENSFKPGLIAGTGSVQTGGSDQSLYAQFIKTWKADSNISLQFSAGVATLLPDFDETYALGGITTSFNERFAVFVNYDGKSFHEGVSWIVTERMALSFLLVESESGAFSISFR